jgi:hypothetical protein
MISLSYSHGRVSDFGVALSQRKRTTVMPAIFCAPTPEPSELSNEYYATS